MEAEISSETSVKIYNNTWHQISEILSNNIENFKRLIKSEDGGKFYSPKRHERSTSLYGITSQNSVVFTVDAVRIIKIFFLCESH
jgi:hypothetical protein